MIWHVGNNTVHTIHHELYVMNCMYGINIIILCSPSGDAQHELQLWSLITFPKEDNHGNKGKLCTKYYCYIVLPTCHIISSWIVSYVRHSYQHVISFQRQLPKTGILIINIIVHVKNEVQWTLETRRHVLVTFCESVNAFFGYYAMTPPRNGRRHGWALNVVVWIGLVRNLSNNGSL